ncbi:hypothetical protein IPZ60_00055 [Psychrobacter sp. NG25]|uniref:hypothetical protein n=1 Tax=Psychrobacter sp. NG25 TaxID=2782005 RepID=UPI0018841CCE|nr:hypothetical protein [Psychrobacter sp. NG25]MBF0657129.1 hypothetical protein [Psychrobacter sp. NG25]
MTKPANFNTCTVYIIASLGLCTPVWADATPITDSELLASVNTETASSSNDNDPNRDETLNQLGYQPTEELVEQPFPSVQEEPGWTDERREDVQDQLHEWAHKMDGWFGEPDPKKPAKASLRVVLDTRWANDPKTGSYVTVEPRIRGRLQLPVLERRLSLIIGDEDLDDDTFLKQSTTGDTYQAINNGDRLIDSRKTREDNASIALRWSRFNDEIEEQLGVKTDVDVGVRSIDDPYVKVSIDKDWYEGKKLDISTDSFYRYGLDSEHYAKGALELQYGKSDNRFINNRTTVRYRNEDDDERKDWNNDLRQVHYLGHEKQLSYGVSASGYFESDKSGINSYGPAVSYRQPIWREWLYVQTELNYYNDKDEDKDHYPSALLRMEALF